MPKTPNLPLPVGLVLSHRNNQPIIEIRKVTNDTEHIIKVVRAAFNNEPILVLPTFQDRVKAIQRLIEKGIIYYESSEDKYYFTLEK